MKTPFPDWVFPEDSGGYTLYTVPQTSDSQKVHCRVEAKSPWFDVVNSLFTLIEKVCAPLHLGQLKSISHLGNGYKFQLSFASPVFRTPGTIEVLVQMPVDPPEHIFGDSFVWFGFDNEEMDKQDSTVWATDVLQAEEIEIVRKAIQSLGLIGELAYISGKSGMFMVDGVKDCI